MILKKYNGKLKKRKDLEAVLQSLLPDKANVMFSTLVKRTKPSPFGGEALQIEDCLALWEFQRIFVSVHSMRTWEPDEITGRVSASPWRVMREARIDAKKELAAMSNPKIVWPTAYNSLKDAMREVYAKMVEMEASWGVETEAAETTLASERFSPRRN